VAEKTTTESITNKPGLINRRRVEPFVIGEESIAAGTRKIVHVPVANLYSHDQPLTLPVHVLHGRRPGPVLFISAAIHGDELNGVEILHRLLLHRALRRLRGTLLAVSVVNGFGMLHQSRYLPDRRDLNRSFPGSSGGSLGARLAHIFLKEIVDRSQIGIDLHTAASSRNNLPHVRANLDDEETRALADAFGVPVVIHSAARDGSLREVAAERGVKMLLFEAGEALRFNEAAVRIGLLGILRLMRSVGMLPAGRRPPRVREPYVARSSSWVRAPSTGMVNLATRLGDRVERGAVLARIFDPYDLFSDADLVRSSYEGVIIGINNNPLTHEGDALVHIARYAQAGDVAEELEAMHQDLLGGTLEPWR
jgi:predicted deacylase